MNIRFSESCESMARMCVAKAEYWDFFQAIGVKLKDWPEGNAKKILETYAELRETHGHSYAQHVTIKDALRLKDSESIPSDISALKSAYKEALRSFKRQRFAEAVSISSPNEVDSLIENYLQQKTEQVDVIEFRTVANDLYKNAIKLSKKKLSKVEIPNWPVLSNMVGGFNPGRVCIVTASTGFGKTNVALNLAREASKEHGVLFINMEMMAKDLGERILLGALDASMRQITSEHYVPDSGRYEQIADLKLYYTDGKSLSIQEIYGLARSYKRTKKIKMMFVDYDQKIALSVSRETPEWKALQIAVEQLEELAKEIEIHITLLAQANDDGGLSGSRRSSFPASTVLRFYETNGKKVLQATKNRFGVHNAMVEVMYQPEKSLVRELGAYSEAPGIERNDPFAGINTNKRRA